MSRKTPTQRSREHLESLGYHVEVVEQVRRTPGRVWRVDLFGFLDLIAIRRGEILGVQSTSATNVSSRVRKIGESPLLPVVREAGIRVVVHGWKAANRAPGRKAETYELREVDLS